MKQKDYKDKIFTIPNILCMVRLALIPLILWLYFIKKEYVWSGIVLVVSCLTDVIDGYIARHFHMTSNLGKVLDPIADKFTQGIILLCLLTKFPLMLIPLVLIIIKETFMSISGYIIIKKRGKVMGANWHGKAATACIFANMMLHMWWIDIPIAASHALIAMCSCMIILSFTLYAVRNFGELHHTSEKI